MSQFMVICYPNWLRKRPGRSERRIFRSL